MKIVSVITCTCLIVLIVYVGIYFYVRNKQCQNSYYPGKPDYTLLYDDWKSHWVFLYAFYPIIYLDRAIFNRATEIVDETRCETWTNR